MVEYKSGLEWLLDVDDYDEERELKEIHATLSTTASSITPYLRRKVKHDDYDDSLTMPLIEVLSVGITANFKEDGPCEIYGNILVEEEGFTRFNLYNRNNPEDSETIWKEGTLSLNGPDGGAIISSQFFPSLNPTLVICLKDKFRNATFVDQRIELNLEDGESYDKLLRRQVEGPHGSLDVYFVVFQFAVYATFKVVITTNDSDGEKCNGTDIFGSIVTEYENAKMYCSGDDKLKWPEERRLFDKPTHRPLRVVHGEPISLLRNVVAVPAYSSLSIKVELSDSRGKIADKCLLFQAFSLAENTKRIETQYACVKVTALWDHPYRYLYRHRYVKFSKGCYDEHDSAPFIPRDIPPDHFGRNGTEVFSVYVSGITEKISALSGKIVADEGWKIAIYNRDDAGSEMLSQDGLISIDVNYRAIENSEFVIILYLKDPVSNLEVSRGHICWNAGNLGSTFLNLRLCSIVRGDNGFAAVHYSIFGSAFQALVEVKLFSDGHCGNSASFLYGTLFGRYGGYDYSTSYQQKYYSSRLFYRPRDKAVETKFGSPISMMKSIVIVPTYSFLIIEANLGAFDNDGIEDSISGEAKFKIDIYNAMSRKIVGRHYEIEISVRFKYR